MRITLDHWAIGTAPSCSKIVLTEYTPSRTESAETGLTISVNSAIGTAHSCSKIVLTEYTPSRIESGEMGLTISVNSAIGTAHSCSKIVLTEYTLSRTETVEMGLTSPTMRAERCSCSYLISNKYLCNTLDHPAIGTAPSCRKIVLTEYTPSRIESGEMGLTISVNSAIGTAHSCRKIVLTEYPPSRTESAETGLTSATMRAECSCSCLINEGSQRCYIT